MQAVVFSLFYNFQLFPIAEVLERRCQLIFKRLAFYLFLCNKTRNCIHRLVIPADCIGYYGEVKEASSDPGVQHGVVGFREAGVDWSLRNGVEVTRRLMAPTAASLAGHQSTETALLRMRNDILVSMNKEQVTLLVFLDLSAALI